METIVEIQLERLQKLLDDRKITLELDESARKWLAEKGYDPAYGARPLKRVIQKQVQDPLAEKILLGEVPRRRHGQDHRRHRPPALPAEARRAARRSGVVRDVRQPPARGFETTSGKGGSDAALRIWEGAR